MEKENMKKDEALKALQIHVSEETIKASIVVHSLCFCVCVCMCTHACVPLLLINY